MNFGGKLYAAFVHIYCTFELVTRSVQKMSRANWVLNIAISFPYRQTTFDEKIAESTWRQINRIQARLTIILATEHC